MNNLPQISRKMVSKSIIHMNYKPSCVFYSYIHHMGMFYSRKILSLILKKVTLNDMWCSDLSVESLTFTFCHSWNSTAFWRVQFQARHRYLIRWVLSTLFFYLFVIWQAKINDAAGRVSAKQLLVLIAKKLQEFSISFLILFDKMSKHLHIIIICLLDVLSQLIDIIWKSIPTYIVSRNYSNDGENSNDTQ